MMLTEKMCDKTQPFILVVAAFVEGIAVAGNPARGLAAEPELAKVPLPARDAAKRLLPDVEWKSAAKEKHGDHEVFELTGRNQENQQVIADITPSGKVIAIRTETALTAVPNAVWKALAEKFPLFEAIDAFEIREGDDLQETEDVDVIYEISGKHEKGKKAIVGITAEGEITEVERQIDVHEIPPVVLKALKQKWPSFKAHVVYEISEEDRVSGYQIHGEHRVGKDEKAADLFVSADGKEIHIGD